jgi:2'-5' RNA ligase
MKYFVGYLIEGEAAEWYNRVAGEISERFRTFKIHEKIPAHLTVYRPFECDNLAPINDVVSTWAAEYRNKSNFRVNDFDHFGSRVIFGKVEVDSRLVSYLERFRDVMKIQRITLTGENYPGWIPHMTLANYIEPRKFTKIWKHISTLDRPDFTLPFNNLTVFNKREDGWEVGHSFPVGSTESVQ